MAPSYTLDKRSFVNWILSSLTKKWIRQRNEEKERRGTEEVQTNEPREEKRKRVTSTTRRHFRVYLIRQSVSRPVAYNILHTT